MFRPMTIGAVLNGWIVTCGCQQLAYTSRDQLIHDLDQYLRDPDGTERQFLASAVNRHMVVGVPGDVATILAPPSNQMGAEAVNRVPRERRDGCRDVLGAEARDIWSPRAPDRGQGPMTISETGRCAIRRELDRLAVALRDHERPECYREFYAAQQALSWALDPCGFSSPYAAITGDIQEVPAGCLGVPRPPSS